MVYVDTKRNDLFLWLGLGLNLPKTMDVLQHEHMYNITMAVNYSMLPWLSIVYFYVFLLNMKVSRRFSHKIVVSGARTQQDIIPSDSQIWLAGNSMKFPNLL